MIFLKMAYYRYVKRIDNDGVFQTLQRRINDRL